MPLHGNEKNTDKDDAEASPLLYLSMKIKE